MINVHCNFDGTVSLISLMGSEEVALSMFSHLAIPYFNSHKLAFCHSFS